MIATNSLSQSSAIRVDQMRRSLVEQQKFKLSDCAKHYLKALTSPFDLMTQGASLPCIPDVNSFPSWKISSFIRGTFNAGTNGFGYLAMNPLCNTNNLSTGWSTTNAYAGFVVSGAAAVGNINVLNPRCPFASTAYTSNGIQSRTVGCGLRARYIGTELNRGGRLIVSRYPYGSDVDGANIASLLANPNTISVPVSRKWTQVTYVPDDPIQYEYWNQAILQAPGTGGTRAAMTLIIACDGTVAGNAFEYQVVYFHEFAAGVTGAGVPNATPTHSDAEGLSAVRDVVQGIPLTDGQGDTVFRSCLKSIENMLPKDMSGWITAGTTVAKLLL